MIKLNLIANTNSEQRILDYLQNNASETLSEKINNGTPSEKDGLPLINKKSLSGFMQYACKEAKKLTKNGEINICIEDNTVFNWAIHYFEENTIIETLYTADGTIYKEKTITTQQLKKEQNTKKTNENKVTTKQITLFDFINEPETNNKTNNVIQNNTDIEIKEKTKKVSYIYQKYMELQNTYSDAVILYKLGDFYEVLGENAKIIGNELDLTITGRDYGLEERIPMIGFPYHVKENYTNRILEKHNVYIYENENESKYLKQLIPQKKPLQQIYENIKNVNMETGEIQDNLEEDLQNDFDTKLLLDIGLLLEDKIIIE